MSSLESLREALKQSADEQDPTQLLEELGYSSLPQVPYDLRILLAADSNLIKHIRGESQMLQLKLERSREPSMLFIPLLLEKDAYRRAQYAAFAREISTTFKGGVLPVLLFFAKEKLTLSFMQRRPSKRLGSDLQVLLDLKLLYEIDMSDPHRGHLDILDDLRLTNCEQRIQEDAPGRVMDADSSLEYAKRSSEKTDGSEIGLVDAWANCLSTELLNKKFYKELVTWFEWARKSIRIPQSEATSDEDTKNHYLIKLACRLIFVWFLKEKHLIPNDLFHSPVLMADGERSEYYRHVLEPLFFETLNKPMSSRRYAPFTEAPNQIRDRDADSGYGNWADLLTTVPFVNGGLFEAETGRLPEYAAFPDKIFFDPKKGIFSLFDRYKFTTEENTSLDQEVALDPELLGRIFENLLGFLNVHDGTKKTRNHRKTYGSYYTPRPIVEKIVADALVTHICGTGIDIPQERLQPLFSLQESSEQWSGSPSEAKRIVSAIAQVSILDPAVGSGAFLVSALHQLVAALKRLDPTSAIWRSLQIEKAKKAYGDSLNQTDRKKRKARIAEINKVFDRYTDSDYGEKLSLIQNNLFGVDIEPMATRIAKLRMFISLAIEQTINRKAENLGFHPLPNLECRIVTADSLKGLPQRDKNNALFSITDSETLLAEIQDIRQQYFLAQDSDEKQQLRKNYRQKQQELSRVLSQAGSGADHRIAEKIADYDPFATDSTTDWFDARFMFGQSSGFDAVVGNPPYAKLRSRYVDDSRKQKRYSEEQYPYSEGKDPGEQNLYKLFVEHAHNSATSGGTVCMIVSSTLMADESAQGTRELLINQAYLRHLIEYPKDSNTFQNVTQGTCIYLCTKNSGYPKDSGRQRLKISVGNTLPHISAPIEVNHKDLTVAGLSFPIFPLVSSGLHLEIFKKAARHPKLENYIATQSKGDIDPSNKKSRLCIEKQRPVGKDTLLLRGRHTGSYAIDYRAATERIKPACLTEASPKNAAKKAQEARRINASTPIIITGQVAGQTDFRRLGFAVHDTQYPRIVLADTLNKLIIEPDTDSYALLALLNSKFMDFYFRTLSSNNHAVLYLLEVLPIPQQLNNYSVQLASLAKKIMERKENALQQDTSPRERISKNASAQDCRALETEIDRIVYNLFDLTPDEIEEIENKYRSK